MRKIIKFKDYVGKIIYNEEMYDVDEFEDYYREEFDEEFPKEVYGAKIYYTIGIDLEDELYNRVCDNGYEEMEEVLDFRHHLLKEAQELIDEWVKSQGVRASSWCEDMTTVIDLTELYNKCMDSFTEEMLVEVKE